MSCDNCKDMTAFYCPICAPTTTAKAAVCDVCHDPTCPCGKVVMQTDAELIDALRACRWILSEKVKAAFGTGYSQQTVDAIAKERDALRVRAAKAIEAGNGCVVHGCWTCDGGEAAMDAVAAILNDKETP